MARMIYQLGALLVVLGIVTALFGGERAKAQRPDRLQGAQEVAQVLNAKSIRLKNGEIVRLASLQAPNIAETHGKMRAGEPMGKAAHAALRNLLKGQSVTLEYGAEPFDRRNRHIAFVHLQDGTLVQQAMVQQGWAMVYGFPDNRAWVARLLPFEREARNAKRGIWAHDYWQVQSADSVSYDKERYVLVEGVLKKAAKVKGQWYLNFGEDWKTDFTGSINKKDYKATFNKQDLTKLEGKRLRLRGWVHRRNGPMMDILMPEQIEQVNAAQNEEKD